MIVTKLLAALLLSCVAWRSEGYRMFADRIPNGYQVPHPCHPNALWHGVGHFNVDGGGFRNPFGTDFDNAGKQWTAELCGLDSDGDGLTNGQELGDPQCVWKVGDLPTSSTNLSHPGICNPIGSEQCKTKTFSSGLFHNQEEWMDQACMSLDFNCSAIHQPGVKTMSLKLDDTPVPAKETTYICQIFDFPDHDNDYHMIASTPIKDNVNILHHMIIFGCEDDVEPRSAYECDMLPDQRCKLILTVWTLGLNGDCFHSNAGIRIGKHGLKRVAVQLHWNNPGLIADSTDSSGLMMHYTPHLRPHDSSVFLMGNARFTIPPRTPSTSVVGRCTPTCTSSKLNDTIYVTSGLNHMHYLGRSMTVEQIRNGAVIKTILNDPVYDYDSPRLHFFPDPIPVEPGDELRTTCHYSSLYKNTTTVFGESTSEEMCYAFLNFYPYQNIPQGNPFCTTHGSLIGCDPSTYHGCHGYENHKYRNDITQLEIYKNVTRDCRPMAPCTDPCLQTILQAQKADPCLQSGEAWDELIERVISKHMEGRLFLASMQSCQVEAQQYVGTIDFSEFNN